MAELTESRSDPGVKRGVRRHLEGWQAGAVVVLMVAGAVLLAVPRAVPPTTVPLPAIDHAALLETTRRDDDLAATAEARPLDTDVRAVGRDVRAYNAATARRDELAVEQARRALAVTVTRAIARGPEELLALRAYQTRRFLDEVTLWQDSGTVSTELTELAGDFMVVAQRNRWCTPDGRRLALDEPTLRTFYKKRWGEVTGLTEGPFALTLDEDRVRYGFLLRHPFEGRAAAHRAEVRPELAAIDRRRAQLETIARLEARDVDYPGDFARGVVLYQMGRFGLAVDAFRRHLTRHEDGPYALRAHNHLKAALDHTALGVF